MIQRREYPELAELEKVIHDPGKPWYRRAVDLARKAPELAASFVTVPNRIAFAKVLAEVSGALADLRDEQRDKEHKLGKGGLHYLLRIRKRGSIA